MKTLSDWGLLIVGVVLSSLGGIFLKMGASRIDHAGGLLVAVTQMAQEWRLFVGAFCYFIPVLIWIFLLKRVEITVLQPLFALVYISTPILAIPLLGEHMPLMRWLGILVIIGGIVLVVKT